MEASVNPILLLVGAGVCAVVIAGAVWMLVDDRRRRVALRRSVSDGREAFRQRVAVAAAEALARNEKRLGWTGLRDLRVSAVVDECVGVKSFYLAAADGRPLPSYQPGQYLTLHLPAPGGAKPVVRCYSLSDRPREEFYRITVKHCPPPESDPGAPPGVGTTILHSRIGVGAVLRAAAPRGDFFLPPLGDEPVVLIGAGIGVTPLLSMLLAQQHAGLDRETYLLAGFRDSKEHPFKQTVLDLAAAMPGLHPFVAYSRPTHRDIEFQDYQRRGRLDIGFVRRVLPSPDFRFYVCGPPEMMQSLVPGLLEWGVPDDQIYFEAFGPASVDRDAARRKAAASAGAEVSFTRSGVTAEWTGEDPSLLAFAERNGVPLEAGCRVGNCGACAARLVNGGVATTKDPGARPAAGECLTCVSVPTGPVVIEA